LSACYEKECLMSKLEFDMLKLRANSVQVCVTKAEVEIRTHFFILTLREIFEGLFSAYRQIWNFIRYLISLLFIFSKAVSLDHKHAAFVKFPFCKQALPMRNLR
jgi:hypothetical protein